MRFKVKDIGEAGVQVDLAVTGAWMSVECPDLAASPGEEGIKVLGRIETSGDAYLLRGAIRGPLVAQCARCLEPARLDLDLPLAFAYEERDEDDNDEDDQDDRDVAWFSGGIIDLTDEIRDEILLALPIGPLCRPDCAGICSVCGGNRNVSPCDCEERQRLANSKFGALKDLKA